MIHLLFTGGTISMQRDPAAGGNVPAHGGEALVGSPRDWIGSARTGWRTGPMLPACHLGPDRLWALRERVRQIAESGEVRGIVITHGTDTLEETAYLLDRTLDRQVPVAITGAMRTSSDHGWDGPRNLLDAAAVAASDAERRTGSDGGVQRQGSSPVNCGEDRTPPISTPLPRRHAEPDRAGEESGNVRYVNESGADRTRGCALHPRDLAARIALVPMVVGDTGDLLDLARPKHDGVVVVAFGSGNVPPGAVPAIGSLDRGGEAGGARQPVPYGRGVSALRLRGWGSPPGGHGRHIPAGPRAVSQARMELMIAALRRQRRTAA